MAVDLAFGTAYALEGAALVGAIAAGLAAAGIISLPVLAVAIIGVVLAAVIGFLFENYFGGIKEWVRQTINTGIEAAARFGRKAWQGTVNFGRNAWDFF